MAEQRRTIPKEPPGRQGLNDLKADIQGDQEGKAVAPLTPEQAYAIRKAEVTRNDHEEFLRYLQEKEARQTAAAQASDPGAGAPAAASARVKSRRRGILTAVAGTAVIGEAALLAQAVVENRSIPAHGLRHAGETIERELINAQADIRGRGFGNWVLLMPTKLGGGTYAVNLRTGRCLAWITYWPYGDYNPISHHLCAFPSADPVQGFEFINSTQGGMNSLIYGIPTAVQSPAEGFNIYRVRYDGSQMEVMENVAETTGLGLGVHVTIDPKTAERYFVTDGQKDIAACFDRRTSRVIAALRYDWEPNDPNLAMG